MNSKPLFHSIRKVAASASFPGRATGWEVFAVIPTADEKGFNEQVISWWLTKGDATRAAIKANKPLRDAQSAVLAQMLVRS